MDLMIVGSAVELASQVFKFLNKKESLKYVDKLYDLRKDLNSELEKPLSEQNDAKVESFLKEIKLIQEVALVQLQNYEKA